MMVCWLVSRGGQGGADGDGFAGADLAGDYADAAFGDTPADAGHGFAVGAVAVQHAGGEVAAEGHAGEAVEALQFVDHGVSLETVGSSVAARSALSWASEAIRWAWWAWSGSSWVCWSAMRVSRSALAAR
jgi:hypothetical protein